MTEAPPIVDERHLFSLHSQAIGNSRRALLASLRERQVLARSKMPQAGRWMVDVDRRVQLLLTVLCSEVDRPEIAAVDVLNTPVDQLFPLDQIDRATMADCGGIMIESTTVVPGPIFARTRGGLDAGPPP